MQASPESIRAAAQRLRGHLVQTPMVGEPLLPGQDLPPGLRIKAEFLQVGGSLWFRGIYHFLLRSLGRHKGLWLDCEPAHLLAAALAARQHRLPMLAQDPGQDDWRRPLLLAAGVELLPAGSDLAAQCRGRGYLRSPGPEDPEVAAGLASLGLELAAELPLDGARVYALADPMLAAVRAGMAAADCRAALVELPAGSAPVGLAEALAQGLKVQPDPAGLVAFAGLREPDSCVLLYR